jgi:hypothetical protein
MERYESWIERAKSSLELAQAKIIRHIRYEERKTFAMRSRRKYTPL